MNRWLMLPGTIVALIGVAVTADFGLTGPTFPDSPLEVVGWAPVLGGLLEMKLVARLAE